MDEYKRAFELFEAHMKTEVIPTQLQDAFTSPAEAQLLIELQWKEMPQTEKDKWLAKATRVPTSSSFARSCFVRDQNCQSSFLLLTH
jgi:hypothetical protein